MKMGTIVSPLRYDGAIRHAPNWQNFDGLRSCTTPVEPSDFPISQADRLSFASVMLINPGIDVMCQQPTMRRLHQSRPALYTGPPIPGPTGAGANNAMTAISKGSAE